MSQAISSLKAVVYRHTRQGCEACCATSVVNVTVLESRQPEALRGIIHSSLDKFSPAIVDVIIVVGIGKVIYER